MRATDGCFLPNQQTHRKSASLINDCFFFYFTNFRGEGLSLYRPCRCVPPQRVGFFALFRSENGYRLSPFWSGIG